MHLQHKHWACLLEKITEEACPDTLAFCIVFV